MSREILAGRLCLALFLILPATSFAGDDQRVVTARVLDAITQEPLADAAASTAAPVSRGSAAVTTDAAGRFTLSVVGDSALVTVRRVGYRPITLTLRADAEPAEIRLQRAPIVLTSIIVTAAANAVAPPGRGVGEGSHLALSTTSRETIAARPAPALAEAMEGTEAVSTSRPGGWGSKAFVRGLGGERVVVLLDGNRLNRACNVGMDGGLATVNPDNVERVEVLSGPGSTLYGSGNVGGVINIVTRGPREDVPLTGELRMTASSAVPGGRAGGTVWGRRDRVAFTTSLDAASYGDQRSPRGTIDASSFRDATLDASGTYGLGLSHRLDARVQRYAGRDVGYPGAGDASIPEEDRLLLALDYGWQASRGIHDGASRGVHDSASRGILDGVNAKLYLQSLDHHMTMAMVKPPAMMGGMPMRMETDARSNTDTWGGRAQARLAPARAVGLDAGIEATQWNAEGTRWIERQTMGGTTTMVLRTWPGVRVADVGAFAQSMIKVAPRLDASVGGRLDDVVRRADGFATTTEWVPSGNAGLRVAFAGEYYARVGAGVGYRIPDPTELYGLLLRPDGYLYMGEPGLNTETSRSVELSIGRASRRARVSATLFRNRITDFISTVVTGDSVSGLPVRQYRNVADARIDGVTGSASFAASSRFECRATAGYTRGENSATGAPLPSIPPFEATVAARVTPRPSWPWIEPEWTGAARQRRVDAMQGEASTPGFSIVNLRAGRAIGRMSVTIGAENLFDASYRHHLDPSRVSRPGRNAFVKIARGL